VWRCNQTNGKKHYQYFSHFGYSFSAVRAVAGYPKEI
jgi:hypothetical protein